MGRLSGLWDSLRRRRRRGREIAQHVGHHDECVRIGSGHFDTKTHAHDRGAGIGFHCNGGHNPECRAATLRTFSKIHIEVCGEWLLTPLIAHNRSVF
jgi:hypothetical protein